MADGRVPILSETGELVAVALSSFGSSDRRPLDMLTGSQVQLRLNESGRRLSTAEVTALAADATGVIAGLERYDDEVLRSLPRLRCISRCGTGLDNVDLEAAHRRGIHVANTPDAPVSAVAEMALLLILALSRRLVRHATLMRRPEWTRIEAHDVAGKRIGLIGLGRVGRRLAALLVPLGVELYATDPASEASGVPAHVRLVPLTELLESADIVTIQAARTSAHPLRIGRAELERMRRGALLVNVARGGLVDEDALLEKLRSGHLAGAALDVFSEEPYSGPLCEREDVILTPHVAAFTVETRAAMEIEAVRNVLDGLRLTAERSKESPASR